MFTEHKDPSFFSVLDAIWKIWSKLFWTFFLQSWVLAGACSFSTIVNPKWLVLLILNKTKNFPRFRGENLKCKQKQKSEFEIQILEIADLV